jgi:hypothetical protein
MAKRLVLPRVHAMMLCDDLEPSADEEWVFHLYGVRSRIEVDAFPYSRPQLCVYVQLTGHAGTTNCRVIVVRPETEQQIYSAPLQVVECIGPLDVVPVFFVLEDCEFDAPGVYYVQVFCDQKLVCERPLLLLREE